jgi:sulfate/thiosulfate transport system substrate-binding protein
MSARRSPKVLLALVLLLGVLASACGSSTSGEGGDPARDVTLSIVGFAVPRAANDAAQVAFAKSVAGKGVKWQSYGASGDQSRAVLAGLKADYVVFSLESDITRLVTAIPPIVAADWNAGPTKGIVSKSVVVLAVRPGNPKNIKGWEDLTKSGIGIVTPNPGSSGSARWNILAAFGNVIANGGTESQARDYLTAFFKNVVALPGSGRDATTAFLAGTGDVLISYENEAILARQQGEKLDYLVPDNTLLIENPGGITVNAEPAAKDYLDFVLSKAGQTEFAKVGFRPLVDVGTVKVPGANNPDKPFPEPAKKLLTIATDFSGWTAAAKRFFDTNTGIVTLIQKATGKSS